MSNTTNKVLTFMKKNGVYIVLGLCVLAIGLSVALAEMSKGSNNTSEQKVVVDEPTNQEEQKEPTPTVITFTMPVLNTTSISDYSDTMVFNKTLKRYSAHKAIDFYATEGSEVYAVYDGKVESVDTTLLNGITVVLDHGNGLKTVYNSLAENDTVLVGQQVKKGDVIGSVSTTNRTEYSEGAHLHFSVEENGIAIDPVKYLAINEK